LGIQGKEIFLDALLDSGASANFLDKSVVDKYGLKTTLCDKSFILADGSTSNSASELSDAYVTSLVDDGTSSWTTQSFKILDLNFSCILGLPWLQSAKPAINWVARTLSFRENSSCESPSLSALLDDQVPEFYSQYKSVFLPQNTAGLPPSRPYDLEIRLKDPLIAPKGQPIYQLSLKEQNTLKEWISDNLKKGFIRNSKSNYAAPIFFVPKKDGTLRPCIDYRDLNQNTVLDMHPLPLISQLMDQLVGSTIFTKLDLRGAYNLVRIKSGDEYKAAFRCKDGHFEPLVVQFGLTNAPACFQRFMYSIFKDFLDKFVIVYLDDILIYSKDLETHKSHVKTVLRLLKENQLSVKGSKCVFHSKCVHFLGYVLSEKGVYMDPIKVKAISEFPQPGTVNQLRSFLGLCNFYRSFIKDYSEMAKPLTDLTGKGKFIWTKEASQSMDKLKESLIKDVMLSYPDQTKQFFLDTDASDHTISSVLSQYDSDQQLRPVAFFSRKLSEAELNYSVYDKELLSILESLKYWRHYLVAPVEPTQIRTDHKNLLFFKTPQLLKPRHARWAESLAQFPFHLVHVKGKKNSVADGLTRADLSQTQKNLLVVLPDDKWSVDSLNAINTRSDWPEKVKEFLELDKWDHTLEPGDLKFLNEQLKHFELKEGKLYFRKEKRLKLYVPIQERQFILKRYHEYLGHLASDSILPLVERHWYWPTLLKDLKDYIARCPTCQLNKNVPWKINRSMETQIRPIPPVALPFERWGLDFIQNLPETKSGNKHIITAIDYATRWAIAKAVPEMTKESVIKFLYEDIIVNYGVPLEIITDRGSSFLSEAVEDYIVKVGISHLASAPYHPETNGMVERMHATLNHSITSLANAKRDRWDEFLNQALFSNRVRNHSVTKFSPFYLLYGIQPRLPMDPRPPPTTMADLDNLELDELRNNITIRELEELGQHRASAYFRSLQQADKMLSNGKVQTNDDSNSEGAHYFQEGDMVKLKHHDRKKFEFKWKGPYHIVRLGHPGTYHIMSPRGDILDSPINQRDLAPWLATTQDNQDYFYDGTTRDFSENASRKFSDGHYSDSPQTQPSPQSSFVLGSLEGDSVTPQGSLKPDLDC
jgi:hypothetical protein